MAEITGKAIVTAAGARALAREAGRWAGALGL
jgi:hypothetical protein